MIRDLRVVERVFHPVEEIETFGTYTGTTKARFAIRSAVDGLLRLYVAPLGAPDPEQDWKHWMPIRDLPTPKDHLLPCGCLPTSTDAHRVSCPLYPEGKR